MHLVTSRSHFHSHYSLYVKSSVSYLIMPRITTNAITKATSNATLPAVILNNLGSRWEEQWLPTSMIALTDSENWRQ